MESQNKTNIAVRYQGGEYKLVSEAEVKKPSPGKLLIKNAYSTINPYDRIVYRTYKIEGFTLGCDGCGIVVDIGEGVSDDYKGKKVAFVGDGWSRYCEKDPSMCMILDDDLDLVAAANAFINPLTVAAMVDYC